MPEFFVHNRGRQPFDAAASIRDVAVGSQLVAQPGEQVAVDCESDEVLAAAVADLERYGARGRDDADDAFAGIVHSVVPFKVGNANMPIAARARAAAPRKHDGEKA